MAARKAVAKTGIAGLPAAIQERLAAKREKFADREKPGAGKQLGIRGKRFKFAGEDVGSELPVIVLDYRFVNQYFTSAFDPDHIVAPTCFAIGVEEGELAPVDDSPEKQHPTCAGCWANEFGSAPTGRGKACQNRRRVAVVSAVGIDKPGYVDTLDHENVAILSLGGTSIGAWKGHVNKVGKTLGLLPFQVVTRLGFNDTVAHEQLTFDIVSEIEDTAILARLVELSDEVAPELDRLPDFSTAEAPAEPQAKKKASGRARSKYAR